MKIYKNNFLFFDYENIQFYRYFHLLFIIYAINDICIDSGIAMYYA